MAVTKHQCLICKIEWGDSDASDEDISHGYCPLCIRRYYTDRIRQAQRNAGFSDCFNRGFSDCSEFACWFWSACQDRRVAMWDAQVIDPAPLSTEKDPMSRASSGVG
jgi:hypothetical protein